MTRVTHADPAPLRHSPGGDCAYLDGEANGTTLTLLFSTRDDAREYVTRKYGYIRHRPGLLPEPSQNRSLEMGLGGDGVISRALPAMRPRTLLTSVAISLAFWAFLVWVIVS